MKGPFKFPDSIGLAQRRRWSYPAIAMVSCLLAGCEVHITRSSSGWSESDLTTSSTVQQSGTVPAGFKTVEVENYDGSLTVSGASGNSLQWSQQLKVRGRNDTEVQELAKELTCRMESAGDRLKLIVSPPNGNVPVSFESDLVVVVPPGVTVKTRNHYGASTITRLSGPVDAAGESGSVDISEIQGEVHAQTCYAALDVRHTGPAALNNQSGSINASEIDGPLSAETSYAQLVVRNVNGTVTLRDQSGSISVEHAGTADIQTSYASLRVVDINGDATLTDQSGSVTVDRVTGKVRAETSYAAMDISGGGKEFVCIDQSGSIRVHAGSPALTRLDARTSYAPLEVWLPGAADHASIRAHTSYASVESDFPLVADGAGDTGPPRVTLENQSGKIRVTRE